MVGSILLNGDIIALRTIDDDEIDFLTDLVIDILPALKREDSQALGD